jgi:FkbH-like protein
MNIIEDILKGASLQSVNDYFRVHKTLQQAIKKHKIDELKKIKVALLTSFTTKGYKEILIVEGVKNGLLLDVYMCEYGQYPQEILDSTSGLYKHDPKIIFLFIDTQTLMGGLFFIPYSIIDKHRKIWIKDKQKEILDYINIVRDQISGLVVVSNFCVPTYSPLGIMENKQKFGYFESIQTINQNLSEIYKNNENVFVFDFDNFCSQYGKNDLLDETMYYMGDFRLKLDIAPALCKEYIRYILAETGIVPKKCIVLDLDGTLWGGILGEDGFDGIQLGPTREGRPFWEFQKLLLALHERGIILTINSKNNFEDAMKVIREHPNMVLREEHFAAVQINWNDKPANMNSLATEINIGLDSMVFFDNEKINRDMMRTMLPQVTVVNLPEDPSLYVRTLQSLTEFDSIRLTDDDKKRGKMYADQKKRNDYKVTTNINDYLQSLSTVVKIIPVDNFTLPRIAQLTQRTNQWNMTTRRYTEEEIKNLDSNGKTMIVSISSTDKFGDNGTVGVGIVKRDTEVWEIDTYLLSCRVIGRGIEQTLLWYILDSAKRDGVKFVKARFIPTKKNEVAKDFYKEQGFEDIGGGVWEYDLSKKYERPEYIEVIRQ